MMSMQQIYRVFKNALCILLHADES